MQCSNCVCVCVYLSFSRSRFPSLSLSWPLYLAFSFRIVISRGSEQRAERAPALGTVCQLVERDSNSIGWPGRLFAAEPVRFGSLPPFRHSRSPSRSRARQNMPTAFLYFYIKRPFHRVRRDTHRLRSFLSASGRFPSPGPRTVPRSPSLVSRSTIDRHGTARCGQHETRQSRGEERRGENPEGDR